MRMDFHELETKKKEKRNKKKLMKKEMKNLLFFVFFFTFIRLKTLFTSKSEKTLFSRAN